MFKSNKSKTFTILIGSAIVGSAATLTIVFLLSSFKNDGDSNWRAGIPNNAYDGTSHATSTNPSVQTLKDILSLRTKFERQVALYGLLANANETRLLEHLNESKGIESSEFRNLTERVVFQRLAVLNPQRALDEVNTLPVNRHEDLISTIFEELSLADLDEAKSYALQLDPALKHAALRGILKSRHKHADNTLLDIARQLDQETLAENFLAQAVAFSAHEDPAAAWSQIVFDGQPNMSQTEFLINVATEWLFQDGIAVIDQISESLKVEVVRDTVITAALHQIAQHDPRAALLEATKLTSKSRELVLRTIAQVWATIDPETALASIETMEIGKTLALLQESVIVAWAIDDPTGLLEVLSTVPEHFQGLAKEKALLAIARVSSEKAVSYLADLEDDDLRMKLAKEIATYWSEQDPHAALDWVLQENFTTNVQQAETLMIVLGSLAMKDPELAFQTARDQPIVLRGQYYRGMEVTVIQNLVETNIDQALAMLPDIRSAGLTQTHAYSEVGRAMIRDGQYDRALKLGERLSERGRKNYNGSLMYQWAMSNPETLFENLDKLPSDQLKDQAARGLVRYNQETKALDSQQMEHVASFLPEGYVDPYNNMRRVNWEWRGMVDQQVQMIFLDNGTMRERISNE